MLLVGVVSLRQIFKMIKNIILCSAFMFTKYSNIFFLFLKTVFRERWYDHTLEKDCSSSSKIAVHLEPISQSGIYSQTRPVSAELKVWFFASMPYDPQRAWTSFSVHSTPILNCSPAVPSRNIISREWGQRWGGRS